MCVATVSNISIKLQWLQFCSVTCRQRAGLQTFKYRRKSGCDGNFVTTARWFHLIQWCQVKVKSRTCPQEFLFTMRKFVALIISALKTSWRYPDKGKIVWFKLRWYLWDVRDRSDKQWCVSERYDTVCCTHCAKKAHRGLLTNVLVVWCFFKTTFWCKEVDSSSSSENTTTTSKCKVGWIVLGYKMNNGQPHYLSSPRMCRPLS